MNPAAVIVLAAGEGTRMKSRTIKVLHELCGEAVLGHALDAARATGPERLIVVVGHARQQVEDYLTAHAPDASTVVQDSPNGTGHAVRCVLEAVGTIDGTVLVTYGDVPLLRGRTLNELLRAHSGNAATILTAEVPDPTGYGRIVRDGSGAVQEIVEHKDATEEQRGIGEINSGVIAFDGLLLADAVKRVSTANAQGEEYLTDVIAILRDEGHRVGGYITADPVEVEGINDRVQLAAARRVLNDRILEDHMRSGVTIIDPATTWIEAAVTINPDAVVHPQTQLQGQTSIATGAEIGPGCTLRGTIVGEDARVIHTWSEGAEIGAGARVGPYTYLRPNTRLGAGAKVGAYVEMKNASVGDGAKVPHLTYVGDAAIGAGSNIGAGTIFANYDGVEKHHTDVGDHVFLGSNTVLVAPVEVEDGAYTAAGSTVTGNVPPGAIGIARGRQRNVDGWVERRRAGTASAEAARKAAANRAQAQGGGPSSERGAGTAQEEE